MSAWIVYFVMILDNVCNWVGVLGPLSLISSLGVLAFYYFASYFGSEDPEAVRLKTVLGSVIKWLIPFTACVAILSIFLPTTKQACAIYVIPKIANNEQVQQIPDKVLEYGNKWLDEQLKDLDKK